MTYDNWKTTEPDDGIDERGGDFCPACGAMADDCVECDCDAVDEQQGNDEPVVEPVVEPDGDEERT